MAICREHDPIVGACTLQSFNSFARALGIQESSLRRYKIDPELIDREIGPPTILTDDEKMGLATVALWLRDCGLPMDKVRLKKCAKDVADARGVAFKTNNGLPSDEWFDSCVHRMSVKHGINLTLRASNVLSRNVQKLWASVYRVASGISASKSIHYQTRRQG